MMPRVVRLCRAATLLCACLALLPSARAADAPPPFPGARLAASTDDVTLWWTSSGRKVGPTHAVPEDVAEAATLSVARNEVEATQIVVRPKAPLRGFTATAGPLVGPGEGVIPAENVEVLRVRFVDVKEVSDFLGLPARWPDPLPPFAGPIDLEADRNQPLWVRVKVPKAIPAGIYRGSVRLAAENYSAEVALHVRVYDFDLPDRMTCSAAFGFDPGNVWLYQRVTDPQKRREVLEKYLADFGAHHISPYDPAPLDPFGVQWTGVPAWERGRRDTSEPHGGRASLLVVDDSATMQMCASYGRPIPIPAGGLRLRFWYRTKEAGHAFIVTFSHNDAGGQWMWGKNNDMRLEGNGEWQAFDRTVTEFPEGARSITLNLWACMWEQTGQLTGSVRYDDLSVQDAGTGAELVEGGDFEPVDPATIKATFDWTAWDAAMERAMGRHHFTSFSAPIQGLGGGTFHSRVEPGLFGFTEDTPECRAAFRSYTTGLEAHLREKGWLDEAFVYWFDEPDPRDYAFVMNGFRKLKETAPGLRRMLTEEVVPKLVGGPNLWCPHSYSFRDGPAEERRKEGDQFWWYLCTDPKGAYCTLYIDRPGAELRVWLWQTWQRKIEGILIWHTNYWTSNAAYADPARPQNPYEDPMSWVSGYSTPAGTKRPWGNGDGRFIYPPEAAADGLQKEEVLDGPVDSIRWEMLRDGIEDYEYLAILQREIARASPVLPEEERRRLRSLLDVPETITKDMTTLTRDPAPIEARRDEVARAIEGLRAK